MFATIVLYSVTLPSSYAELLLISSYLIMVTKLLFTFRPSGMLGLYFLFGGSIKIILHLNLLIWTILFFFYSIWFCLEFLINFYFLFTK